MDHKPNRATSVIIAKSRMPTGVLRSQLSSNSCTFADIIVGGRVANRHPPTAGTAGDTVMPCKYRNLRIERSSATRPFADPDDTRAHSRSRNVCTSAPVSVAAVKTSPLEHCSCKNRRAVFHPCLTEHHISEPGPENRYTQLPDGWRPGEPRWGAEHPAGEPDGGVLVSEGVDAVDEHGRGPVEPKAHGVLSGLDSLMRDPDI